MHQLSDQHLIDIINRMGEIALDVAFIQLLLSELAKRNQGKADDLAPSIPNDGSIPAAVR